jgi:hypothetical protein
MHWPEIIAVFAVIATNLTTVIVLFCHMDNKAEKLVQAIREDVKAIQQEMKDFHGRLERQDAEFKGKLALQDAEMKAHILQHHQAH